MQHDVQLGQLIHGEEHRDAIHIAVAPVTTTEFLSPGERISLIQPGVAGKSGEAIGIVDPFLTESVLPGEKFWMLLFPYTITTLRHHWEHPAFVEPAPIPARQESEEYLEAKRWIENYADSLSVSYEDLMRHAQNYVSDGDYWNEGAKFDGESVSDQFWDQYEVVTGTKVPDRENFFSCSC